MNVGVSVRGGGGGKGGSGSFKVEGIGGGGGKGGSGSFEVEGIGGGSVGSWLVYRGFYSVLVGVCTFFSFSPDFIY